MAIYHIILYKFKQDVTPDDAAKVSASLHGLPSRIPAISDFRAGPKIKHPLDQDYDEGIILIFKDQDALQTYTHHPAHLECIEYIKPYIQDILIFNIDVKE